MHPRELLDFLIPLHCAGCGAPHQEILCRRCHAALPWLEGNASGPPEPAHLQRTVAAVAFSGDARHWIHRFKYPGRGISKMDPEATAVVRMLARSAAGQARDLPPKYIVAIPAHRKRFRQRGFNPAYLVAREISRHQTASLECGWLTRVRHTAPQYGLNSSGRSANVLNAFSYRARKNAEPGRVWLVDDVVTTGATLGEAARTLRQAGFKDIVGICLARTAHLEGPEFPNRALTSGGRRKDPPPTQ